MPIKNLLIMGVFAGVLLISSSLFTVEEYQKAILFRFGEIQSTDFEPGLHFKLPFVNNVKKYDSRVQTLDARPERFLTSEKKNLIVDSYVMWRIVDLKKFYTSVLGDKSTVENRLDQIVKDSMRGEFSQRTIKQAISKERNQIMETLKKSVNTNVTQLLGIEILDVRIKRIDLPLGVSTSVYSRMQAERQRIAKEFRAEGEEEAEKIRAGADRDRTILLANAYKTAEQVRGEGDGEAAGIFAKAYGKNPEFYALYRSLDAYKNSFNSKSDILVLDQKNEFFNYFRGKTDSQ
jgi:modulator of FtsH protease HflC